MENRRRARRVAQPLPVRYVQAGGPIRGGCALDISESGARLKLPEGCETPHELTLELEGRLTVLARTVWHEWSPEGEQMVGVVFEGVHWGLSEALHDYVNELETRRAA